MKEIRDFVETQLPLIDGPEKVYQFFHGIGYKTLDPSFHGIESWGLQKKDRELINNIYTIANYDKRFQIFLVELKSQSSTLVKNLPLYFEKEVQYPFFVITNDYKNYTFVLVEKIREDVGIWKRKIIKLNLDRTNAYYTDKLVISNIAIDNEYSSPKAIYNKLREAFSVEKVSKIFFEDYQKMFFNVRQFLCEKNINIKEAHEFSQQLLNRIMFIYFIDKKRWLKKSPKFVSWLWDRYSQEKTKNNELNFYTHWLSPLFFEAFNNQFTHSEYLPDDVQNVLTNAPYLNGGLFKKYEFDDIKLELPDDFIKAIINFLEKYNFTIREDLPLDVEVAIDPQMIGYVYESLANVAEEIYERQDLGIFYTPKAEVDFMCRRSLSEYLYKSNKINKEIIYNLLFNENKQEVEKLFKIDDYEKLEYALDNLSVLDPACGSGAFLVGMLYVLVEMYKFVFNHLQREMTDYGLKKSIISNNLYGVDVMPWAVHSAELRLWLSLMIESDLRPSDLKRYPLLPNLNLKLRIGDSLVQEIGGLNLNLRDVAVSPQIKQKLSNLKREKEKYYNNDPTSKFKTPEALLKEEDRIFNEILIEEINRLEKEKQNLRPVQPEQQDIFQVEPSQKEIFDEKALKEKIAKEKQKLDDRIQQLIKIKNSLKEQKPFVWDIDFAEIFGDKGGFDIVIGNPPYIRQEKIAHPNMLRSEITNELKKEYKEKLLKSVQAQFDQIKKIDKKSDYYIYFYFHGLSLLNRNGTFCFITSNSWLDVGYGKDLQEFLLKYVPIIAIYDNQVKRSFEHADVNTIIALFGAPYRMGKSFPALKHYARFVMFKKPFDEVINAENLIKIEKVEVILNTDDFRVFPKKQIDLLNEGWEYSDETTKEHKKLFDFNVGKYTGNKWGGKYLRAPDIYFICQEKQKNQEIKLGHLFEGERYLNTGGADGFFILTNIQKYDNEYLIIKNLSREGKKNGSPSFKIKKRYLKPLIKDITKSEKKIIIEKSDAYVLNIDTEKLDNEIKKYIKWGEKVGFNKRSVTKNQMPWFKPTRQMQRSGKILFPRSFNENHLIYFNPNEIIPLRFYRLYPKKNIDLISIISILNSTYFGMLMELNGPGNLGLGVLDVTMESFLKINIPYNEKYNNKLNSVFKEISVRNIYSIFRELGINPKQPIRLQKPNPLPDRKVLDDIVFDILGLTQGERNEVYWAVCELVKNRLEKARSM